MPSEDEILAVEKALARLFRARHGECRREAIDVITAVARARRPIDEATQIPAAEGEREICQCNICGRKHWSKAKRLCPA